MYKVYCKFIFPQQYVGAYWLLLIVHLLGKKIDIEDEAARIVGLTATAKLIKRTNKGNHNRRSLTILNNTH